MAERPVVLVAAEPVVQRLVQSALGQRGFRVSRTTTPGLGSGLLADLHPDVVVLDSPRALEETCSVLERLADADPVPVIVTDAVRNPVVARSLLDAGAADVLPRPFDPVELAARVRSLLRRRGPRLASGRRPIGRAIVDLDRREVVLDGTITPLARAEWRLLLRLLEARGEVVSQDALLEAAFGREAIGDVTSLQAVIGRLRRKLGASRGEPGPITTVRGFGYAVPGER